MRDESDLSLTFIRQRPGSAAAVVASQPTAEAAAYVETVPVRHADKLLSRMPPGAAAAIVTRLSPNFASDVLHKMDFVFAATILRQVPERERAGLLKMLPARRKRAFDTSLSFAEGTVGALMTTSIDALSATDTVAAALRAKRDDNRNTSELVYVVDDGQRFIGVVTPVALIRNPDDTRLSALADSSCVSVSPYLRLSEINELNAWDDYAGLPVVSRRRELLGAIERRTLRQANRVGTSAGPARRSSVAGSTLEMMGYGALNLIDLLVPPIPSNSKHGADDGR